MLRKDIICLFLLLLNALGLASNRNCPDLISIESDLPQPLVEIASDTLKTYFKLLSKDYFQYEPNRPLNIFLCMDSSVARNLIASHGNLAEAGDSFYVPSMNALYTYFKETNTSEISWNPVFSDIAEYLVDERFPEAPMWFRYGLTKYLSENVQVSKDELTLPGPCPKDSMVLLQKINLGEPLSVIRLINVRDDKFDSDWPVGKPFSEMFFHWLNHNRQLNSFIINVYNRGLKLHTLEETISSTHTKINREFFDFIRNECSLTANIARANQTNDFEQAEAFLEKIINSTPSHWQGRLALARLYFLNGKKTKCLRILEPLLIRDNKSYYMPAAKLTAASLYDSNKYIEALEYYRKAWDRSDYYLYKYQIAYKIANCYHYLKKPKDAAKWYSEFLALNWFVKDNAKTVQYAEKYIENFGN